MIVRNIRIRFGNEEDFVQIPVSAQSQSGPER